MYFGVIYHVKERYVQALLPYDHNVPMGFVFVYGISGLSLKYNTQKLQKKMLCIRLALRTMTGL